MVVFGLLIATNFVTAMVDGGCWHGGCYRYCPHPGKHHNDFCSFNRKEKYSNRQFLNAFDTKSDILLIQIPRLGVMLALMVNTANHAQQMLTAIQAECVVDDVVLYSLPFKIL